MTASVAVFLLVLGASVAAGWVLRIPQLTQIVPGLTGMVFNTAVSFVILGAALLVTRLPDARRHPAGTAMVWVVALMSLLNLVQGTTGLALGINAPVLHAWMKDGNPAPGQMATVTSLCFLLASSSFLLTHRASGSRRTLRAARAAAALLFCIAGLALLGYVMQLESLYSWYAFGRMAVHTAVGLLALALALWTRLDALEPEDRTTLESRIIALGSWALAFVALFAGLCAALILKQQIDRDLADGLRLTHQARSQFLDTSLELRSARGRLVATRPLLRTMIRQLAEAPAAAGVAADLGYLDSFQPHGFRSLRLLDRGQQVLARTGTAAARPDLVARLSASADESRELIWHQGFALRQRFAEREDGRLVGYVETEQPLPQLDRLLRAGPAAAAAENYRTELCGQTAAGFACFPADGRAEAYVPRDGTGGERGPLWAARSGRSGVDHLRSGQGTHLLSAYGPVGGHGLVAATSLDSSMLFAPLRQRLTLAALIVAAVTGGAIMVLRRSVRPLTRALVQAEQRYRGVLDSLHEGVVVIGAQLQVLAANPAAARILGTDLADLLKPAAQPRWRLVDTQGLELDPAEFPAERALRSGRGETDVVRGTIDAEGRLRWLELTTTLITEGAEQAVVLSFEDITERRLAALRLEASEARHQLMVDQVADYAILMLDVEGRVTSWNQGAALITGYAADEIMGRHFGCFFLPEEREAGRPAQELESAAQQGRSEFEGWRLRKDGSRFWGSVVISAIRDPKGTVLGFAKLTRDLTERHRADQALAEAWRRVQAMIESSPFGIVATDLDGTIRHINPAGERMTGYTKDELVGKLTPLAYHDTEEVRARARELSAEVGQEIEPGLETLVHKAALGFKEEREWTCVRKDGSRFPVFSALTAMRDPAGDMVGYMGVAYDITERRRQEEYTRHVANHDYLTGLPMRRLLDDRLQVAMAQARRSGQGVGLMLIDLDHFKRINDSLGHHIGDELLKEVAQRLVGCVRGSDTVARMGGDEFVVLLPDIDGLAPVERVASQIVQQLSVPVRVGSHDLHVTPSVGLARFPHDADHAQALLKNADTAMYTAKEAGRGCYRVFSRQMQHEADERLMLENELRQALKRREVEVHYQPQVCLVSGDVVGMEALLRWTHPVRGAIPPSQFVPIAEESGLILELGEWVLRSACHAARRLQQRSGLPLRIAVNLSARQFRAPGLTDLITDALRDSGLDAGHLELEITESMLMSDVDQAVDRLARIRALGVKVAIDDFGTGYSSLSYVARFRVDTLKIDRSFVQRLPASAPDDAVVQAIMAIARSLDVHVVAEGVETAAQLGFLRARHCDVAQGALFGMAVPAERLSVQGFHIGKAVSETDLLPLIAAGGQDRLRRRANPA